MSRKYGPLETSDVTADEYDIIHAEGYASCLRDMITNLEMVVKVAEEQELDFEVEILKLIDTARETLAEDNNETH